MELQTDDLARGCREDACRLMRTRWKKGDQGFAVRPFRLVYSTQVLVPLGWDESFKPCCRWACRCSIRCLYFFCVCNWVFLILCRIRRGKYFTFFCKVRRLAVVYISRPRRRFLSASTHQKARKPTRLVCYPSMLDLVPRSSPVMAVRPKERQGGVVLCQAKVPLEGVPSFFVCSSGAFLEGGCVKTKKNRIFIYFNSLSFFFFGPGGEWPKR